MSQNTLTKVQTDDSFSYDDWPYESACLKQTHADNICRIISKAGFRATDCNEARILELGCGIGGNLIPFALTFPKTECVGIDLSTAQINMAQQMSKACSLKNVSFLTMDIMSLDEKLGAFDYIICHGVFSWVPQAVRNKILEICSNHLTSNGIALISYNTLPGWYFDYTLRDALRFHTKGTTEQDKVHQARNFTDFLAKHAFDGTPMRKTYKTFLQEEAKTLAGLSDNYIFHDQLADENQAFHVTDFIEMAAQHDLQYIGEAIEEKVTLDADAEKFLNNINNTPAREQYYDILTCRRFRLSLLTHKNNKKTELIGTEQHFETTRIKTDIREHPHAFIYARQQVLRNRETPMLTTMKRESIKTTLLLNLVVLHADGTNTHQQIAQTLSDHIKSGDLIIKTPDGNKIDQEEALPDVLTSIVIQTLQTMSDNGLLEA